MSTTLTPRAALSLNSTGYFSDITVYCTDSDGNVSQVVWSSTGWGHPSSIGAQIGSGSPLSAIASADSKSVRLYFVNPSGQAEEWCNDGKDWYKGGFTAE